MSTSALITLHGLSLFNRNINLNTVTFYRHSDGDMNWKMADFFYQAFDNPFRAKGGYFDSFMCAEPSEVEFFNFFEYQNNECGSQYHYHLNVETMELIVMHEDEALNIDLHECFRGPIDLFINTYSYNTDKESLGYKRAVLSSHDYGNLCGKHVFTVDGMIRTITRNFEQLRQYMKHPLNPNNRNWIKQIDRRLIFLGECHLSDKLQAWRENSMKINLAYEAVIHASEAERSVKGTL